MNSPDNWGRTPLMWERVSGAIALSRSRGWVWEGRPAGSTTPETLVGRCATPGHDDVVVIEMVPDPMTAIGARFAPGDWGRSGAKPLIGPIDGAPDAVLVEALGWPGEVTP